MLSCIFLFLPITHQLKIINVGWRNEKCLSLAQLQREVSAHCRVADGDCDILFVKFVEPIIIKLSGNKTKPCQQWSLLSLRLELPDPSPFHILFEDAPDTQGVAHLHHPDWKPPACRPCWAAWAELGRTAGNLAALSAQLFQRDIWRRFRIILRRWILTFIRHNLCLCWLTSICNWTRAAHTKAMAARTIPTVILFRGLLNRQTAVVHLSQILLLFVSMWS